MKQLVPFPGAAPYPRDMRVWKPEGSPRAAVLIAHGMAEHIDRYERLALRLNQEGFLVMGYNHLGHGPEAPIPGWFAERDGWGQVVADLREAMAWLARQAPGAPRVLLGHSMGSFLSREYAIRYPDSLDALVLSGTGWYPKAMALPGLLLAGALKRLGLDKTRSALLNKLAFSANNKPFKQGAATPFDWLSRDEAEVRKYVEDPSCGFVFTTGGFYDLFSGLKALSSLPRLSAIPAGLPICLLSGEQDPVGQMGLGVKAVCQQYKDAGVRQVRMKLYEGSRHEIFNETNRNEVMDDLAAWLNGLLPSWERGH